MTIYFENSNCPYCKSSNSNDWANESGWQTKRCVECSFIYVNPRPRSDLRDKANNLGVHPGGNNLNIIERRVPQKVKLYRKILLNTFGDVWANDKPIKWIDIGAGYGELVEAVTSLATVDSIILGIEPMQPKVTYANKRGIKLILGYMNEDTPSCQFASAINIFSHIYDFDDFLKKAFKILEPEGEIFIITGDMGKVYKRNQFPGELGLPDHVAFASEKHLIGFLERNGFRIISVRHKRVDGLFFTFKNLIKRILGRTTFLAFPYSSPYREIQIRAKKQLVCD